MHGTTLGNLEQGLYIHANARGVMAAGLQAEVRRAAGGEIERELRAQSPLLSGSAYLTSAGELEAQGVLAIAHGVIVRDPGGEPNRVIVEEALAAGLQALEDRGCRAVTIPQVSWQYGQGELAGMAAPLARTVAAHLRRRSRFQQVTIVSRHEHFLDALRIAIREQPGVAIQGGSHESG